MFEKLVLKSDLILQLNLIFHHFHITQKKILFFLLSFFLAYESQFKRRVRNAHASEVIIRHTFLSFFLIIIATTYVCNVNTLTLIYANF